MSKEQSPREGGQDTARPPTQAQAHPLGARKQQGDYLGYRCCRSCWAPRYASSGGLPCTLPASTSHTPGRAPCLHDRPGGSAAGLGWRKKHCRSVGRKANRMRRKLALHTCLTTKHTMEQNHFWPTHWTPCIQRGSVIPAARLPNVIPASSPACRVAALISHDGSSWVT